MGLRSGGSVSLQQRAASGARVPAWQRWARSGEQPFAGQGSGAAADPCCQLKVMHADHAPAARGWPLPERCTWDQARLFAARTAPTARLITARCKMDAEA